MFDFIFPQRRKRRRGIIQGIYGPMGAGKTDELIRIVSRYKHGISEKFIVFTPKLNYREAGCIATHDRRTRLDAVTVDKVSDILNLVERAKYSLIAIDEIHFFHGEIIDFLLACPIEHTDVIWAGLDKDFRGLAFPLIGSDYTMRDLIGITDFCIQKTALCDYQKNGTNCLAPAIYSVRFIKEQNNRLTLAPYDDTTIAVGGKEGYASDKEEVTYVYGALCPKHTPILKGSPSRLSFRLLRSKENLNKRIHDGLHRDGKRLAEILDEFHKN